MYFGAQGVILCERNSAPLSPAVSRSSAGALEVLAARGSLFDTPNLVHFLSASHNCGWRILGTTSCETVHGQVMPVWKTHSPMEGLDATPSHDHKSVSERSPTILIFGSEGAGVRTNILRLCDALITIPSGLDTQGKKYLDSLNVGVAMGIFLYESLLRPKLF